MAFKQETITFRIDNDLRVNLQSLADKENISLTEYVKKELVYIAENKKNQPVTTCDTAKELPYDLDQFIAKLKEEFAAMSAKDDRMKVEADGITLVINDKPVKLSWWALVFYLSKLKREKAQKI